MRLVLLGPPGAGKGTQAQQLWSASASRRSRPANILREHVQRARGSASRPARTWTVGSTCPRTRRPHGDGPVGQPDADKGFILDGFPRTVPQAKALEEALAQAERPLSAVLKFAISDDMAVRRLSNRWTCPACKRTYNLEFKRPVTDQLCATPTASNSSGAPTTTS